MNLNFWRKWFVRKGVWTGEDIDRWARSGGIEPYLPENVSGASIDLTLSNQVCYLRNQVLGVLFRYGNKSDMGRMWEPPIEYEKLFLRPNQAVLLSTNEYVKIPTNACGQLLSKSTAGRCLIEQMHAGYADAGYRGTLTLEIINCSNVTWDIRPGDKLVQLIMSDLRHRTRLDYAKTGRYQGQVLPTAPKGW